MPDNPMRMSGVSGVTDATTTDLIRRLRTTTAADRDLDAEIALACGWTGAATGRSYWRSPEGKFTAGHAFTASIDAALTLVPEGAFWTVNCVGDNPHQFEAAVVARNNRPVPYDLNYERAATPAIAICIAALAARGKL